MACLNKMASLQAGSMLPHPTLSLTTFPSSIAVIAGSPWHAPWDDDATPRHGTPRCYATPGLGHAPPWHDASAHAHTWHAP